MGGFWWCIGVQEESFAEDQSYLWSKAVVEISSPVVLWFAVGMASVIHHTLL